MSGEETRLHVKCRGQILGPMTIVEVANLLAEGRIGESDLVSAEKGRWITVEEFGIGFPPRIASITWHGTRYSLNWIPLGGFVRMLGEDGDIELKRLREGGLNDAEIEHAMAGAFNRKPIWVRIGVLVADVSGHGVPAALVASMVKLAFTMQREHACDPARVLMAMNQALCRSIEGTFVTAVYGVLDGERRSLKVANAGHPSLLVGRPDGSVTECAERGVMLGLMPDASYSSEELILLATITPRPGEVARPRRVESEVVMVADGERVGARG